MGMTSRFSRLLLLVVLLVGVTKRVTSANGDANGAMEQQQQPYLLFSPYVHHQQQQQDTSELDRICSESLRYQPPALVKDSDNTANNLETPRPRVSLRSQIICSFLMTDRPETEFLRVSDTTALGAERGAGAEAGAGGVDEGLVGEEVTDTDINTAQHQHDSDEDEIDDVNKRASTPPRLPSLTSVSSPGVAGGLPSYRRIGLRMDFGKRRATSAMSGRREGGQQAGGGHFGYRMDFGKRRTPSVSVRRQHIGGATSSRDHFGFRMDFGKRRAPSVNARDPATAASRHHHGFRMDFGKRRAPSSLLTSSAQQVIGSLGRGLRSSSSFKVAARQPHHFGFRTDFGKRSEELQQQQQQQQLQEEVAAE